MNSGIAPTPSGHVVNSTGVLYPFYKSTPPTIYGKGLAYISGSGIPQSGDITLAFAKQTAVQHLTHSYVQSLSSGITVSGITLAAQKDDQQAFNNLLTLLTLNPISSFPIADIHGQVHTVTMAQYYSLMGSYGQEIANLWGACATAKVYAYNAPSTGVLATISLQNPTGVAPSV